METINLKVHDLSEGTEFQVKGFEGIDLRLENASRSESKEYVDGNKSSIKIIGEGNYYFRASAKAGGTYQTKIPIYVAGELETNLTI